MLKLPEGGSHLSCFNSNKFVAADGDWSSSSSVDLSVDERSSLTVLLS